MESCRGPKVTEGLENAYLAEGLHDFQQVGLAKKRFRVDLTAAWKEPIFPGKNTYS